MEERPRYREDKRDRRRRTHSRSLSSTEGRAYSSRGDCIGRRVAGERDRRRRTHSRSLSSTEGRAYSSRGDCIGRRVAGERQGRSLSLSSNDERGGQYRDRGDRKKKERRLRPLSDKDHGMRHGRESRRIGHESTWQGRSKDERVSRNGDYRDSRSRSPEERYTEHRRRSPQRDDRKRIRDRDEEPSYRPKRSRSSPLRSPPRSSRRSPPPRALEPYKRSRGPLPSQEAAFTRGPISAQNAISMTGTPPAGAPVEKQKPNFTPSGALAAETNTVAGTDIVLKYNEPPESRKPPASKAWRLFVFKGSETIDTLELGTRSCWLFGRARTVVDYPVDHPSCSQQHAVLQFRFVEKKNEFGDREGGVRPYIIDLESTNGTKVNGEKVPERRYVELISGDVLGFGDSTREYVILLPPKE